MKQWIKNYIEDQKRLLDLFPIDDINDIIRALAEAHGSNRQVFVFGNGGSAATAGHFVADLGKCASDVLSKRFRCFSLNEHISWVTAVANDDSYEDIYVRQLENYANPGDLVITFSVSGSSPNLVKAFKWANSHELHTIAFTGGKGGQLSQMAKKAVVIPSEHYAHVEDIHMIIMHILGYAFIEHPEIEIKN